jgi:hypothetical protein
MGLLFVLSGLVARDEIHLIIFENGLWTRGIRLANVKDKR